MDVRRIIGVIVIASVLVGTFALPGEAQEDASYAALVPVFGHSEAYWRGLCEDLDPRGVPHAQDPDVEQRPVWGVLATPEHWEEDTDGRPYRRYPDYRKISNNLKLVQTLQFLLSVLSNVTEKLEDAQAEVERLSYEGLAGLGKISQEPGHCICTAKGGCAPGQVLGDVDELLEELLDEQRLREILEGFVDEQADATVADLEGLDRYFNELLEPGGRLEQNLTTAFYQGVDSELRALIGQLKPGAREACDLDDFPDYPEELEKAVEAAALEVGERVERDYATLTNAVETVIDLPATIDAVRGDAEALLELFAGVETKDDLLRVDFGKVNSELSSMVARYEADVEEVKEQIAALTALWEDRELYEDLSASLRDRVRIHLEGTSVERCLTVLGDENNFDLPDGENLVGFGQRMRNRFLAVLEAQVGEARLRVETVLERFRARVEGAPGELLDDLRQAAETTVASGLSDCYLRGARPECFDFCEGDADDFLWLHVDFLQDPATAGATALEAGKFALKQAGWLDGIREWVGEATDSKLANQVSGGLDKALGAVEGLAEAIEAIQEVLGEGLEYADRFIEGSHLGAYSVLRPDLHMCVPYAGHGAYAQLGSLGGDRFSLGARYTSHNLSRRHRAAFRSGGFAASAFGRELSLLPSIELNTQIDGFELWNPERPLGIPVEGSIDVATVEKLDVFNVVPTEGFNTSESAANPDFQQETVQLGSALVRDLFPSKPVPSADSDWPRPGVEQPWEDESTAVASLGLNLAFDLPLQDWKLPTIVIIPPTVLTATPTFGLGAGTEWTHQSNLFRNRIEEMVNVNLPSRLRLGEDDFARDMHAFQAPDLSTDDRTEIYVEPSVGVDAFLGFRVWKVQIGAGAHTDLRVDVRPGGQGGVLDLNTALSDAVAASNPPKEAVCEAQWSFEESRRCSNGKIDESTGSYACEPLEAGASCCVSVDWSTGRMQVCLDDWTGMDAERCQELNRHVEADKIADVLENVPGLAASAKQRWIDLATEHDGLGLTTTWNAETTCSEIPCGDAKPEISTAGLHVTALSECETYGYCTHADGRMVHDVTLEECEEPDGYWRAAGGSTGGRGRDSVDLGDGADHARELPTIETAGRFTPYSCRTEIAETLEGWAGDGCHPLQHGFPSACACTGDEHCASGESCDEASGQCLGGPAREPLCLPSENGTCRPGRVFLDGACTRSCTGEEECPGTAVCEEGLCRPPHGIPFAEEIAWGMDHVEIPRHTINTYALSDFQALLLLKAGVYVEASFKLFGKAKTWRLLDFADAWDLGSTYKGWYQPGLSAPYDDECIAPTLPWQVTNYFPASATSDASLLGATNAAGVPAGRHCGPLQGGGVCRYPEPPVEAAGDVHRLVRWCRDDLPKHVENPHAPTNGDLAGSMVETTEWGQELGLDLWAENQLCVDGQVWTEWMETLPPTYDDSGAVVEPGNLAGAICVYEDPDRTGVSFSFPCAELAERMLAYWGCTTVAAPWSIHVAKAPGVTTTSYPDIEGAVLDLDSIFVERPPPDPFVADGGYSFVFENLRPALRTMRGIAWLHSVSLCFDKRFQDPAETACECTEESGCKVELGERCRQGRCERPRRYDDEGECLRPGCEPVWEPRQCPIVRLEVAAGPCCGDGVVQRTATYEEECDPEAGADVACDARCRLTEPRGACCLAPGLCTEDVAASRCKGSFHADLRCAEVESCQPDGGPVLGSCCDPVAGCREEMPAAECGRGTWSPGLLCSDLPGCDEDVVGACCEGVDRCREGVRLGECRSGAFHPGRSCQEVGSCRTVHPPCAPAPPGMSAWWTFDDGEAPTVLERRSGANGTLRGGVELVPGRVGRALELDGVDGRVEVPDDPSLALGEGDFSVDLWLAAEKEDGVRPILDKRRLDRPGGGDPDPIHLRRSSAEPLEQPAVVGSVNGFELYLYDGRPGLQLADGGHTNFDSGFEIADGRWHHLAVTVDRDDPEGIRWYLDGEPAGESRNPTGRRGSLTTNASLLIGTESGLPNWLRGRVDEVEIFKRVLAPEEVAAIHASRSAGKCRCSPPPRRMLGWWSFEDEQGGVGRDRRGGAPGELRGAVERTRGVVGDALRFAGGVFEVAAGSGPDVETGDLSIDAWVRTRSTSGTIVDRRMRDGRRHRGYSLFVYRGELGLQLADGRWSNYLSGLDIADGEWHHVAVTVDRDAPDGIRWYLDGEEAGTPRDPRGRTGSLANQGPLVFGGRSFERSGRWRGELDEVEVFGRALEASEIWRIWMAGPEGKCTCPNLFDPGVSYVSRNPSDCQRIRIVCGRGEAPFSNECGCGCRRLDLLLQER